MERYNEEVQQAISEVRVWQASCNSYYRTLSGRVVTKRSNSMSEFRERRAAPDPDVYEVASL